MLNRSKILSLFIGLLAAMQLTACGVSGGIVDANFSDPFDQGVGGGGSAQPSIDEAGADQQEPMPMDDDDGFGNDLGFEAPGGPNEDPDPTPPGNEWTFVNDKMSD